MLLQRHFYLIFALYFWFQASILTTKFLVLIVLGLDHGTEFLLLLVIAEEVIFEFSGFSFDFSIFILPVFDLPLESIVAFLHFTHQLLIFVNFDFIIFVVIYLAIKFQLFLLQGTDLSIALF